MKLFANKKGSSIVSVMVAFIILLIGIAMMYTSVNLSQKMISIASSRLEDNDEAMGLFYQNKSRGTTGDPIGVYSVDSNGNIGSVQFNILGSFVQDQKSGFYYFR